MSMSPDPHSDIREYVQRYAPELDLDEVEKFMAEHAKPDDELGTHVKWAVRQLREGDDRESEDGPPVDRVADELRRRDK